MINSSLDCLQAFSQNKTTNINIENSKRFDDVKQYKEYKEYKENNNYGINFNEIGNKSISTATNPLKNKTGLKLNMQYSSSFEEDLGQKNK